MEGNENDKKSTVVWEHVWAIRCKKVSNNSSLGYITLLLQDRRKVLRYTTGAVYLSNFLSAAKKIEGKEKLISIAHQEAVEPTRRYTKQQFNDDQNPEGYFPKLLTIQQLIISFNSD
ncbi:hypothetical protein MAL08_19980 (plasmid) [Leptospira noguchii]|uniref:hypothetical protein n=1 Tax=Leptospira noguchii TaxID=28182 RepID=UPI001FB7485D|nr:hypothetical protein [Leptospira noguchii]UOG40025.1 hypothetical protein MAL08_19980 [Leptospira noguchii]